MEGLATNITGCTVRGLTLVEECALEGNTTHETERAVMAINAAVTQCGAIWNFL